MKYTKDNFYEVLKSTPEDWDRLYYGQDKKEAEAVAIKNSFDYTVLIEVYKPEWNELYQTFEPAEERLELLQVYNGKIENL